MHTIKIYKNGQVIQTENFSSKTLAGRFYYKNNNLINQYTQLIVDGVEYTTASSERYFERPDKKMYSKYFLYPSRYW